MKILLEVIQRKNYKYVVSGDFRNIKNTQGMQKLKMKLIHKRIRIKRTTKKSKELWKTI